MSTPLTARLGAFIGQTRYAALPDEAIRIAKQGYADCIGVMLAGAQEPVTQAVLRVMTADCGDGPAAVLFGGTRVPAAAAAWINGTSAHALDYDDVALKGSHPSAVLVPAILAEAQALGSSGADMLLAYIVGFEVWGELISREQGNYQRKGWHPTGIFGALGAAAACASLNRLDASEAAHALGIAASEASGVMSNLGSMTKPMHAGKAASCGVLAARFARAGVTATENALEHEQGFLAALSPEGRVDFDREPNLPPQSWRIVEQGLAIKQYPVCYRAHRAIDAMLGLLRRHDVAPDAVREVVVRFSKSHSVILKNHRPRTVLEAKFSIEFALACALLRRRVGIRDLAEDFIGSNEVTDLVGKVAVDINPEEEAGTSGYSPFDTVRLVMADGTIIDSEPVRHARGDPQAPLGPEELWSKFEDCIASSGLPLRARPLFDAIQGLESLKSAKALYEAAGARPMRSEAPAAVARRGRA